MNVWMLTQRTALPLCRSGLYDFDVTRAAPDLRDIRMFVDTVTCNAAAGWLLEQELVWSEGAFDRGRVYTYHQQVPFAVYSVSLSGACGITWPSNTVTVTINGGVSVIWYCASQNVFGVTPMAATPILQLVVGLNRVVVHSSADGQYEFDVTRLNPTLNALNVLTYAEPISIYEQQSSPTAPFQPQISQQYTYLIARAVNQTRVTIGVSVISSWPFASDKPATHLWSNVTLIQYDGTATPIEIGKSTIELPLVVLPPVTSLLSSVLTIDLSFDGQTNSLYLLQACEFQPVRIS